MSVHHQWSSSPHIMESVYGMRIGFRAGKISFAGQAIGARILAPQPGHSVESAREQNKPSQ